jgi:hypothetical protein
MMLIVLQLIKARVVRYEWGHMDPFGKRVVSAAVKLVTIELNVKVLSLTGDMLLSKARHLSR